MEPLRLLHGTSVLAPTLSLELAALFAISMNACNDGAD